VERRAAPGTLDRDIDTELSLLRKYAAKNSDQSGCRLER